MNLFRPLWFTWKGKLSKDGNGGGIGCLQIKIFIFCRQKHRTIGKSTEKTQGIWYYGVFTLSDTENETDTETDNKCTELSGNLCSDLSQCSMKCSAYYSGTHNHRSRCRSV